MKTRSTSRPDMAEERRNAASSRPAAQMKPTAAAVMPDARATSLAQLRQQEQAGTSTQAAQLKAHAELMAGGGAEATVQRVEDDELLQGKFETVQRMDEEDLLQGKFEALQRKNVNTPLQGEASQLAAAAASSELPLQLQEKRNDSGLPDQLKSGIESLSGMSMDHVKVHYNSDKPAQLQAHAYAQGSEIHVAPGQERHVPHEAWHVVQQMQGRVQPTMQMKENVAVNDDVSLEREADVMGAKAATVTPDATSVTEDERQVDAAPVLQQRSGLPSIPPVAVHGGAAGSDATLIAQLKKANMKIGTKDYAQGSYPAIKKNLNITLSEDEEVIINHWMLQEVKFLDKDEFVAELKKLKENWEQQKVFYPSETVSATQQAADSTVRMYSARPLAAIDKLYWWAHNHDIETEGFEGYLEARAPEDGNLDAPMKAHFGDSAHTRKHWHQKKSAGSGVGLISIDLNQAGVAALQREKKPEKITKGGEGYVAGRIGLKQEKNFYSAAIGENAETWGALVGSISKIVLHQWEPAK